LVQSDLYKRCGGFPRMAPSPMQAPAPLKRKERGVN
jgi:hypothetical protein